MENLESGRSQFAPLLRSSYSPKDHGLRGYPSEMYSRRFDALSYQGCRSACGFGEEEKICISARGIDRWHENLYGFTRVVVHGVDSLCVVARTEDLERVIRQVEEVDPYMCNLNNALIYEAEDLALPSCDEPLKITSRSIEKPFVAVSVIPGTSSGYEASSAEYHVDSAIKFLEEEMGGGETFTFDKSVKTAIYTLQHLFGKKFKANEIQVYFVKKYRGRVMGLSRRGCRVNEFPIRGERSIMDHLAVINKPRSGGSSSRRRLVVINKPRSGGYSSRKRRLGVINNARSGGLSSRKRRLAVINKARSGGSSSRRRLY